MTAEIAILNKSGIALAADSAITMNTRDDEGSSQKIHNTASKVIALSKYAPVAIMVYGNAEFMQVPWETIIKLYRDNLGRKRFPLLTDYSKNFMAYLGKFAFTEFAEKKYIRQAAMSMFIQVRDNLDKLVQQKIAEESVADEKFIKQQMRKLIEKHHDTWENKAAKATLSPRQKKRLGTKWRKEILEIAKQIFQGIPLTSTDRSRLVKMVIHAASVGPRDSSGVVFAGFGEDEHYPSYANYDFKAVLLHKVIVEHISSKTISEEKHAIIIPFAQSDDIRTFMTGIGKDIRTFMQDGLSNFIREYFPEQLVEAIFNELSLGKAKKRKALNIAKKMGEGSFIEVSKQFKDIQTEKYIIPVVNATAHLQKGELAAMAETLVSLESFRKQVTMKSETVGGPIDVAIITKGDGLVWIKRKHYFSNELNHHFFRTYFDRVGESWPKQNVQKK